MKRVLKYTVDEPLISIKVPSNGILRHVALQYNIPCIWIEVDDYMRSIDIDILAVPTGCQIPDDMHFVGTVMMDNEALVFHLYSSEDLTK